MRITGGAFRNKKVSVIKGASMIRPTSEKMRQAIFNMMNHASWGMSLEDAVMLDAYCGSGVMGMEALSRGASHVIFADTNRKALEQVKYALANDLAVEKGGYSIVLVDLSRRASFAQKIDFVFMDPPYGKDLVRMTLGKLAENSPLNDEALLLCETEKNASFAALPSCYSVEDERIYGDSKLVALRYSAAINEAE
jgi:16S rRNA (guanine966-N2)-methyltransferase